MRLPFTDKFLWDLYNFLEKAGDIYSILELRPWVEVWNPTLHQFRHEYRKTQRKRNLSQVIYYLKKHGYIKIKKLEQNQAVLITKKGADKILKIQFKTKEQKKRPDGKWQMIIFDIPEKKKQLRELLRDNLYFLKYRKLQQSVWVCPYDVLRETEVILRKYSLDRYIRLILIEEIEV